MLKLVSLIFRNVLRNRRRSILTLMSTAVSLAVLGFLVALYQGFFFAEQSSPSEALRLISRHKVSLTNPLPGPDVVFINRYESLRIVAVSASPRTGASCLSGRMAMRLPPLLTTEP